MKTKPFNLEECMKKYGGHCVTTDLDTVEILKTDLNGANSERPLLVVITGGGSDGWQEVETRRQDGRYDIGAPHQKDLLLLVQTEELFLVIVQEPTGEIYHSTNQIHQTLQDAEEAQADLLQSMVPGMDVTIHRVEIER